MKYFQWRQKYIEVYMEESKAKDLYENLSIDKRAEQINLANETVFENALSEPEDADEENENNKSDMKDVSQRQRSIEIPTPVSKAANEKMLTPSTQRGKRMKKKQKDKEIVNKDMNGDLEFHNISLMNDLIDMKDPSKFVQIKAFSGDINSTRAYLSTPPQMQFVPKIEDIEKMIKKAMKIRFVTEIPKIFNN